MNAECAVCKSIKASIYTCPRCGVQYCSEVCYKSHSSSCSEAFVEDTFSEWLKTEKVGNDEQRKFEKTYKRLAFNPVEEEASIDDKRLEELANLLLSGELREELLTEDERNAFELFVSQGAADTVRTWKPWWKDAPGTKQSPTPHRLIKEVRPDEGHERITTEHICCKNGIGVSRSAFTDVLTILLLYVLADRFTLSDFEVLYSEILRRQDVSAEEVSKKVCKSNAGLKSSQRTASVSGESGKVPGVRTTEKDRAAWGLMSFIKAADQSLFESRRVPCVDEESWLEKWHDTEVAGKSDLDAGLADVVKEFLVDEAKILKCLCLVEKAAKRAGESQLRQRIAFLRSFVVHHTSEIEEGGKMICWAKVGDRIAGRPREWV